MKRLVQGLAYATMLLGSAAALAVLPPEMSDLVQVKSKRLDQVYLLPGTDFKAYRKVMIDATQVSFAKNFLKDTNSSRGISSGKISDGEAQQVLAEARKGFSDIISSTFKNAGIEVVTAPGPDVLWLTPAVINLYVNAPAAGSSATRTYAVSAGQATFVLAVRDSTTGALIGMAIDKRETRSAVGAPVIVDGVVNRREFEVLVQRWAQISVKGFKALQESTPVAAKK